LNYRGAFERGEQPVDIGELLCLERTIEWVPSLHENFFTREQEIDEGFVTGQQEYLDSQM